MAAEPLILYKLMTLYMLKQAKLPLSLSQISEFFLDKEYTTFFTLQQALGELTEAHLIKSESIRKSSRYELTREGEETLVFFGHMISDAITDDIDKFLDDNKIRLREEIGNTADYYKTSQGDYMVECEVREGKNVLIKLEVSAPGEEQAEIMCDHWPKVNQEIYSFIMNQLLQDKDS